MKCPVVTPASLARHANGLQRRLSVPISIGVRMEMSFQLRLEIPFDDSLRDAIRDSRYSQQPLPAITLVDLHSLHRRRKIAARGHAIPELVQIVLPIRPE